MRSVVVYESVCGNTAQVAHAIADTLAAHGTVELVAVAQATSSLVQGADLLVVGAPTHVWGMSWPWTRRIADRAADVPSSFGRRLRLTSSPATEATGLC